MKMRLDISNNVCEKPDNIVGIRLYIYIYNSGKVTKETIFKQQQEMKI